MYWPRVGKSKRYQGLFYKHWEAGNGICVWVIPLWPLLIGNLVLLGLYYGWQNGLLEMDWAFIAGAAICFWWLISSRERWHPSSTPDDFTNKTEFKFYRCFVRFEGVVGRRYLIPFGWG